MKFHECPSSGSRVVANGQTDITKLIVVVHNFANARKKIPTRTSSLPPNTTNCLTVFVPAKQTACFDINLQVIIKSIPYENGKRLTFTFQFTFQNSITSYDRFPF
jgi:hypothetical protein